MNDFLNEVAQYLDDLSVGEFSSDSGRNIFVGIVPADPANCVCLLGITGPTIGVQREVADLQFPRFQAFIRNTAYNAGSDKLQAVRTALHGKYGVILPHWRILRSHADQEGGPIGKNPIGHFEFSINFTTEINAETAA